MTCNSFIDMSAVHDQETSNQKTITTKEDLMIDPVDHQKDLYRKEDNMMTKKIKDLVTDKESEDLDLGMKTKIDTEKMTGHELKKDHVHATK